MTEHAVIIRFRYADTNLEPLYELENQLETAILEAGVGQFDGNDLSRDYNYGCIYMYGDDADELFRVVKPILEAAPFMEGALVRLRYGMPRGWVPERELLVGLAGCSMP
jgi:hypothetical protein